MKFLFITVNRERRMEQRTACQIEKDANPRIWFFVEILNITIQDADLYILSVYPKALILLAKEN